MLHFDIDQAQLEVVINELGATPKQVQLAFNRALNRTAGTLRKISQTKIKNELDLRNLQALRRRIKQLKIKKYGNDAVLIWIGSNDLPVSAFKGRPKKTKEGAEFRGHEFVDGFIGKNAQGKQTIFKRKGGPRLPIAEQGLPVSDDINVTLEDEVFVDVEKIFFRHFIPDLRARTSLGVGGRRGR